MRLNEFYEPENDQSVSKGPGDTRKPVFTLEALNKLRKYRELKKSENIEKAKFAAVMYARPAQTDTI
jgi:hypothetical protein